MTLNDGTQLREYVKDVRGTTENPMPRAEVVAKGRDLIAPVLGAAQCDRLIASLLAIENVRNVRELRPSAATSLEYPARVAQRARVQRRSGCTKKFVLE